MIAADARALLESRDLIYPDEFPHRRVLLLALCHATVSPAGTCCEWCSESTPEPLRVRFYPEVGPHHPQCFIDTFVLMGDAQKNLAREA